MGRGGRGAQQKSSQSLRSCSSWISVEDGKWQGKRNGPVDTSDDQDYILGGSSKGQPIEFLRAGDYPTSRLSQSHRKESTDLDPSPALGSRPLAPERVRMSMPSVGWYERKRRERCRSSWGGKKGVAEDLNERAHVTCSTLTHSLWQDRMSTAGQDGRWSFAACAAGICAVVIPAWSM